KAREAIINKGISYLTDGDVFNRLVPFWQLQLYFEGVGANPDFYPDLFEAFRKQDAAQASNRTGDWAMDRRLGVRNPAVHQLNFIKTSCDMSHFQLTALFDEYGFFYVRTNYYYDDEKHTYNIAPEIVDKCIHDIKAMNLPNPKVHISTLRD